METTVRIFRKELPLEVRGILISVIVLIVLHLLVVGVTITEYSYLVTKIINAARETTPTLTEGELYAVGKWITILGIVYHLGAVILYSWLLRAMAGRNHWARIALTILLVLNFIASLYTFGTSPLPFLLGVTIFGWLLQIGLIALLWIPDTTEQYFLP